LVISLTPGPPYHWVKRPRAQWILRWLGHKEDPRQYGQMRVLPLPELELRPLGRYADCAIAVLEWTAKEEQRGRKGKGKGRKGKSLTSHHWPEETKRINAGIWNSWKNREFIVGLECGFVGLLACFCHEMLTPCVLRMHESSCQWSFCECS
jgi:hypothetical protein